MSDTPTTIPAPPKPLALSVEERLDRLEKSVYAMSKNIDLCVNYCKAVGQQVLGKDRVEEIEKELGGSA